MKIRWNKKVEEKKTMMRENQKEEVYRFFGFTKTLGKL